MVDNLEVVVLDLVEVFPGVLHIEVVVESLVAYPEAYFPFLGEFEIP